MLSFVYNAKDRDIFGDFFTKARTENTGTKRKA